MVKEVEETITDSKGRRVQNRAAQRAFRERKQSQLADLQARIQMYEQGEIERNVALQNVAKRLKEDNEKLRAENATLQDRVHLLEGQLQEHTKKRSGASLSYYVPEKKIRLGSPGITFSPADHIHVFDASPMSTPPSMASSPASSCDSQMSFDPSPEPLEQRTHSMIVDLPSSVSESHQSSLSMPRMMDSAGIYGSTFDCGFCNEDTPCVCREIAMQDHQASLCGGIKDEELMPLTNVMDLPMPTTIVLPDPEQHPILPPPKQSHKSILDNLPAYQAAVPLKRSAGRRATAKFSFQLVPPQSSPSGCSGDPKNCPACSDDSFGRAFCSAIGESMADMPPCVDCPGGCKKIEGNDLHDLPSSSQTAASTPPSVSPPSEITLAAPAARSHRIPTNDAWAQLKAHPNVAFTDLKMLADVVAQRSKCTGPRVKLSPHPEVQEGLVDDSPVLLTDPHAVYTAQPDAGPSPAQGVVSDPALTLVPHEELIRCGRRQVREVEADGVREALRLLDAKYGVGRGSI